MSDMQPMPLHYFDDAYASEQRALNGLADHCRRKAITDPNNATQWLGRARRAERAAASEDSCAALRRMGLSNPQQR